MNNTNPNFLIYSPSEADKISEINQPLVSNVSFQESTKDSKITTEELLECNQQTSLSLKPSQNSYQSVESHYASQIQLEQPSPPSVFCHVNTDLIPENDVDIEQNYLDSSSQDSPQVQPNHYEKQTSSEENRVQLSENRRVACIASVPYYKFLIDKKEFLLNGDIYLYFGPSEFNRIATINKYKKTTLITRDKVFGQLYVEMIPTQLGTDHFEDLAKFCINQPNSNLHFLGEQLIVHQKRVEQLKAFAKIINTMPVRDQFLTACEQCYQNFVAKCHLELKKMISNSTIKFFKMKTVKINYETGSFQMNSIGTSELLLALLGITPQQGVQFVLRKGMFEFCYSLEEFSHEMHFLNLYKESTNQYSYDSMLCTFDGIDIECVTKFIILHNNENFMNQKFGFHLQEFFMIVDYDVTPSMLRKVVEMRKKQPQIHPQILLENESDWNYSSQSRDFINLFYKNKQF